MGEDNKIKRRKSTRLKGYDYSNAGWYFVTICTNKKINFFGKITDGKMKLDKLGEIAQDTWKQIPNHYPEVKLDYFQIMPNHIHGILIIDNIGDVRRNYVGEGHQNNVGEGHALPLRKHSLTNIIGSFKSAVTKSANENKFINFKWQRSFYERIIRNEKELYNIRKYIKQNPLTWSLEKEIGNLDI